jgi:hypothetical protein
MATDLDNLKARRSAICTRLAALAAATGDNPDSTAAGIANVEKIKSLYDELKMINEIIGDGGGFGDDSPAVFEVVSEGYTP